jgi:hypothetical protein
MKIVTAVVNNVDFIIIQYHTLKKYFKGNYEFIVFNDAKSYPDSTNFDDISIKPKIESICNTLNIKCINIPNEHHKIKKGGSDRTADSMNFILKYQIENPDKYLLIDSDMFLVNYFDIDRYTKYDCAIVLQMRNDRKSYYMWNGIYYFDIVKMKNINLLNWDCSLGCDTGGMTQHWLKTQININNDNFQQVINSTQSEHIYFMKHHSSGNWNENDIPDELKTNTEFISFLKEDVRNKDGKFFCELYENVFLHYRAGSNWRREGPQLHNSLTKSIKNVLLN